MKVSNIQVITDADYCQLQAQIETGAFGGKSFLLWYRFPPEFKKYLNPTSGDPFVAALLLPAMVVGESVDIPASVSPKLLQALSTIQDIYTSWDQELNRIAVNPTVREKGSFPEVQCAQVASFFSGGVDSFYTLLKHVDSAEAIDYLILVRGFDISIGEGDNILFSSALDSVENVAKSLGKKVLPVETNIREFVDLFVNWGTLGHGACLASVGLTLESLFKNIYIAASYSYADLIPFGSHPLLDPLWSTERLIFSHDGCESGRLQKIYFIKDFPIVLKTLRICFEIAGVAQNSHYNCGRCRKCLITMIGLHIVGALKQCEVLPKSIDVDLVRNITIPKLAINLIKDLYYALSSSEEDVSIKLALDEAFLKAKINVKLDHNRGRLNITYSWQQRLQTIHQDIEALVPTEEKFILVDESQLKINPNVRNRAIPFPEQNGQYWGPPADDAAAIQEIERQRQSGAKHIIFAWPAFWWLDSYAGMHTHLRTNYKCLAENDRVVAFALEDC